MSEQAFEILCPKCRSVLPLDASACPNCVQAPYERAVAVAAKPQIAALPLKDYHQLVRANHWAVEGGRYVDGTNTGFRFRAYLPFLLLVIGLLVAAAVMFAR
jgi:hypothetical protein